MPDPKSCGEGDQIGLATSRRDLGARAKRWIAPSQRNVLCGGPPFIVILYQAVCGGRETTTNAGNSYVSWVAISLVRSASSAP